MAKAIFILILLFLATLDIKTKRLPTILMLPLIFTACWITGEWFPAFCGFCIGAFIYVRGLMGQKIAEGDVKLSSLLCAMFGWVGIVGILVGIILVSFARFLTSNRKALAFTPFATLAILICLISDKAISAIVR